MVNAQYQVTQEQAVTAAINTTRYNGRSNITSSNVEKINTNQGYIKTMWCGDEECENKIKEETTER